MVSTCSSARRCTTKGLAPRSRWGTVFAFAAILVGGVFSAPKRGQGGDAAQPPIDRHRVNPLEGIDRLVGEALAQGKLPGCVVVVGRKDGILYQKAFGWRALRPEREPMTEDTIFDLASLTKPIATAMSLMVLLDQGKVDLDAPVARYLPTFASHGKETVTLRHLLTHVSGLPAETPLGDYERGHAEAIRRLSALSLRAQPGERFVYSDVGFLVLEEVIRTIAKTDLASFSTAAIFRPLGMNETGFLPLPRDRGRIAPTEQRKGSWMRGEVHDPRAFRLGGIAGNAGLFSSARDLSRFARMVLGMGALEGTRIVSDVTMAKMLAPHDVPGGIRALGWDMQGPYSANRGASFSRQAVGHGGYTGTSLWIDPHKDLFVLFLSNRVHPDGKGSVNTLAGAIATLAASSSPTCAEQVRMPPKVALGSLTVGIDALAASDFAPLRGAHLALLTNDAARTRDGRRTTDRLAAQQNLTMVALLSPEHGLSAMRDERIQDGVDAKTQLPVFSLYGGSHDDRGKDGGANRRADRQVVLPAGIDTLVIDLPDVGVRFYTYAATMHAAMKAAAEQNVRVVILDRPNPINGTDVAGPMLKASERSAVNHHALPIRHGLTMGELAELINAEDHLGARLEVVGMSNYDRKAYYDEFGLVWWPPSPNLPTMKAVLLYPGVALVEGTNVSVGRGTESPFQLMGAPWIDGPRLAAELSQAGLAGVSFTATTFTPDVTPKVNRYAGIPCQGVRLHVDNRTVFDPVRTGIAMAIALRKLFPRQWDASRLHKMIGDPAVTTAILKTRPLAEIQSLFEPDLHAFRTKRLKYLLYPLATPQQVEPLQPPSP